MEFIELLNGVPLAREDVLKLERYAKARRIKPQEAAAAAIHSYLAEAGEIEIRLAAARRALHTHEEQARLNAPDGGGRN